MWSGGGSNCVYQVGLFDVLLISWQILKLNCAFCWNWFSSQAHFLPQLAPPECPRPALFTELRWLIVLHNKWKLNMIKANFSKVRIVTNWVGQCGQKKANEDSKIPRFQMSQISISISSTFQQNKILSVLFVAQFGRRRKRDTAELNMTSAYKICINCVGRKIQNMIQIHI